MTGLTLVTGGEVVATRGDPHSDPATLAERWRVLHRRGAILHHDPGAGRLVCYVAGRRQVPEQYYAEYTDEHGETTFDGLVTALRDLERGTDWHLDTGGSGKQEVFDALADDVVTAPDDPDAVADLLTGEAPVELGTPDRRTAAGLYQWLRARAGDRRLTICSRGAVDELPPTDVVIVPDATDAVGAPAGETRTRVAERRQAAALDRAAAALRETIADTRDRGVPERTARRRVAAALDREGVPETGVRIVPETDLRSPRRAVPWLLLGVALGVLFTGLGVVAVGLPAPTYRLLTRPVGLSVPTGRAPSAWLTAGVVPAWVVLCVAAAIVAVMVGLGRATADGGARIASERARSVREALESAREHDPTGRRRDTGTASTDGFVALVSREVLAGLPFEARAAGGPRRARLVAAAALVLGGVGGTGILLSTVVIDVTAAHWLLALNVVGLLATLTVVVPLVRRVI